MIRLHDTLAREKREFVPADPERITMYVCGPTVYGRAHIGNARPAVVFDTLARLIRHEFGRDSLVYARNVTDVDDKIIAAAEAEGVEPSVITERYERFYLEDMGALGVAPPDVAPHATQEIAPMIAMILALIERGNAYEAEGHVLFSVPSDPDYGVLSRRDREAMVAGARVEVAPYKRDPADFVLWKPSSEGVIGWDSPWGRGRPGWHIECSAMIQAHLGQTIDIHGGGLDLIFPHHENEIAQSRCAHGGAPLARYWVHNGFVDMGAEKMSKSIGNIVTPAELLAQGNKGEWLRYALLSTRYRKPLEWSDDLIKHSRNVVDRWYRYRGSNVSWRSVPVPDEVLEPLGNDLDTEGALKAITRLGRSGEHDKFMVAAQFMGFLGESPANYWKAGAYPTSHGTIHDILGRNNHRPDMAFSLIEIKARIAERAEAKKNRDFATADRIRDELKAEGIQLLDRADGTTDWERE
jgi:cysteinyl-tRNA synthetase